ncbi:hypothetical protein C7450_1305 [Chelatococcus asaccharovorans]|uniref:Uncharacterized protein n=1 Tax=Chelatococcus asaccharovorans TaxID=28210 RepID=A0A2V3TRE0_9HYPH|nr:hypothetical protein C7450_1305 [Chelatococcus asaccharovorans]
MTSTPTFVSGRPRSQTVALEYESGQTDGRSYSSVSQGTGCKETIDEAAAVALANDKPLRGLPSQWRVPRARPNVGRVRSK